MSQERDLRLLQLNHPAGTIILPFDGNDAVNPFYHFKGVIAVRVDGDGETYGLVRIDDDTVGWVELESLLPATSEKSYNEEENEDADVLTLNLKKPN